MCQHSKILYNFSARPIKFHGTCLTAALLNSQSAKNKVDLIGEAVIEHDIDILALTETWLANTPKSTIQRVYKLINMPRPGEGGHGGGVAIIHKDGLSAQTVATTGAGYTTFEHCDVQFTNNSGLLNIIVVSVHHQQRGMATWLVPSLMSIGPFEDRLVKYR